MTEGIGLVGAGLVGTALARRFLAAGYGLTAYDTDATRCRAVHDMGGRIAASPAAVAAEAQRIVLALPDSSVVGAVVEGRDGILESATLPRYIIDTTTGDPEYTAALAARLAAHRIGFVDATLSGSSTQVADGGAVVMAGGSEADFQACQDLLREISDKVFYLGAPGSGSRAKLASNLVLGLNRLVLAEGLVFAERLGLALEPFLALLKASPAYSAAMDAKGEKMLTGDFTPQSRVRQHHKDVGLILDYAARTGQDLPLSAVHLELMQSAIDAGDGELDNAAVIREIRRRRRG
ncbi:MAG: NAD(P)-dependent oxidoreductase [Proteobacteria bacterium]|nr:NAD(P)-dependent oxidoreductase [Pseudomonadota bacterium]